MDKDLKDAVLAAFDGEPADEKPQPDQAKDDEAAPAAAKASTVGTKSGAAQKKPLIGTAGTARRLPTPAAGARKGSGDRDAAEESGHAAPARQHSAPAHVPAPAHSAPRAGLSGVVSLVLTVALVALVVILLVQTLSLKAAIGRQDVVLRDLKNLARITVSVYHEPGKRPQKVIAVHDLDADGKIKLGKMTILPLDEE